MSNLWTQAMAVEAMPWQVRPGEGYMASEAKHVKDAGFAGFVQHPDYEAKVKKMQDNAPTNQKHWDESEPEPTSHDFKHFDEHGTFSPDFHRKHLNEYFNRVQKDHDRDVPDHTDPKLMHFQRNDALFKETWVNHGTLGPVDIKSKPIFATQSHVNQNHIDRYKSKPDDKSWHEQTTGRPAGDYQGGHHPLFVTHQGRTHVIEGHHRVAAALQSGDSHIHAWHIDLDKHGQHF